MTAFISNNPSRKRGLRVLALSLCVGIAALASAPARAQEDFRLQELVERARFTLEIFNSDEGMQQFRDYVPYAHALLIVPEYIKGAFGLGAAGGRGVLVKRDEATGQWSAPVFYRLWSASVGLQLGGSASEMVLIFQSDKGIASLDKTSVKFGVDASVAAGPKGYSAEGATMDTGSADIAAFARVKGAFMGASLSGTSMSLKQDWNEDYYGRPVTVDEILSGAVDNPKADGLKQAAAQFFEANAR